ncbi:ABC transporter substrate-binding protein [Jiangella alkaliphila]|uniref:ABC-type transport system, substrate-binding protein n=1 Tax=Jiangella alkaliphila TaxID=419479 RepID=A0A1H2JT00_9ACTN|nr:ABC transporter substrate-binding protein [Jiangella alkaliphila]SDU59492.1 ABC-type transport system, substrate-binding protein [Jiangella alkaliphila]
MAMVLAVAACSDPTQNDDTDSAGDEGTDGAAEDTTLNAYLYQPPAANWSPMAPANGPDGVVMNLIYDSLLGVNPDYELYPRLATDLPEISEDGLTITYTLQEGLTWSDGEPFTAEDVVFTYNLMANPDTGSTASARFVDVVGGPEVTAGTADTVSGFTAPDEHTFQIQLTKPNVGIVGLTQNIWIVPQHVLADVPLDEMDTTEFFTQSPTVGLGPYTFVEYQTDQYIHLVKNPAFREGEVDIDEIFLRPVTSDVATAQLGTGEMDLAQIAPPDLETVEALDGIEVGSGPGAGYIRTSVNEKKPYLQDVRLRQAMMYAIDRQGLIDEAMAGEAQRVNGSFMNEALPDDLEAYDYDPDRARELLAEMGWDPEQVVELSWIPGQRDRDTAATIVEAQLNEVGIKLVLNQVQPGELTDMMNAQSYDMTLYGGGNYATEPFSVYPINGCATWFPDGANLTFWCNEEFDALMLEANSTVDEAARYELFQQAARIENAEVPMIYLYNPNTIWAYTDRLTGFEPIGDQTNPFWNVQEWSLDG